GQWPIEHKAPLSVLDNWCAPKLRTGSLARDTTGCIVLDAKGNQAAVIYRPGRVPGDLPRVVVGIGYIAPKAAVRRRIGLAKHLSTGLFKARDDRLDLFFGTGVVRQRKGTGPLEAAAPHIVFELLAKPCAEDEA